MLASNNVVLVPSDFTKFPQTPLSPGLHQQITCPSPTQTSYKNHAQQSHGLLCFITKMDDLLGYHRHLKNAHPPGSKHILGYKTKWGSKTQM